jgi:hypothetical protein
MAKTAMTSLAVKWQNQQLQEVGIFDPQLFLDDVPSTLGLDSRARLSHSQRHRQDGEQP